VYYAAGPRLEPDFLAAIARIDDRSLPVAETYRRTREIAAQLGIPRPSYERVRQHVRAVRRAEETLRLRRDIFIDVSLHHRPVEDLYELFEAR
jgi:hypothetical protein